MKAILGKGVLSLVLLCIANLVPNIVCGEVEDRMMLEEVLALDRLVIPAEKVEAILADQGWEMEEFLQRLIPIAQKYARPPISNYFVGAAALGGSGAVYLGGNLEFLGVSLNEGVHGEQFAVANARLHGEDELVAIALSAAPCGYCRQFLNELAGSEEFEVILPGGNKLSLANLLPEAFGPKELGLTGNLMMRPEGVSLECGDERPLVQQAFQAALHAYTPYTESYAGVAIRMKDGSVFTGSYLENVAYNPSVSPFKEALVSLVVANRAFSEIEEVVLVEREHAKISHEMVSRAILERMAPEAHFEVIKLAD
ncbi:MAG: Cytidine deaminase [Chlamydiia bacterium]|nr:Cytidine deaminase [Chlamydiia bacterium]